MVERIRHLCELHHTNFSKLERTLNFANGSIAKTNENTQASRIKAIADYFGVSLEYLLNGEEDSTHGDAHYLNGETARLAQEIHDDSNLRALFDAARDTRPEDIKMAADMLRRFKETNPDG